MNRMSQPRKRRVWMPLLAALIITAACSKNGSGDDINPPGNDPGPVPGVPTDIGPTPIGNPIGTAETTVIGPNGGTFTTSDNRVTLEFPAGALNTETTISIQPVTNNCPGATGNAFRITPHINFNKPVKLGFNYSDTDYIATVPAAMTIAYQDEQRNWRAADRMTKDTTNRKVWVMTDHFSDWALFKSVELIPYSSMTEPGGQINLGVVTLTEFRGDSLLPVPDILKKKKGMVKEWKLSGEGRLEKRAGDPDAAVYTAPGHIPAKNPVAVSAVLNIWSNWQFILVSNIYIGKEGLTFRIDNGPWMECIDPDGIMFDGYFWTITAANISTPQPDGVTIRWAGTTPVHRFHSWGLAWPSFHYGPDANTTYFQILAPSGSPSPGGLYFHLASEGLSHAVGTFLLTPAQRTIIVPGQLPVYSHHRIEGFFKVKWGQ